MLKYGKNTYIDKTFAPDFATAKKIFDIAENYGTKFFSSSALRYAPELENVKGACSLITTGGGSNFEEYIIHQTEMMIKTLGTDPKSVKTENFDGFEKTNFGVVSFNNAVMFYVIGNNISKQDNLSKILEEYYLNPKVLLSKINP